MRFPITSGNKSQSQSCFKQERNKCRAVLYFHKPWLRSTCKSRIELFSLSMTLHSCSTNVCDAYRPCIICMQMYFTAKNGKIWKCSVFKNYGVTLQTYRYHLWRCHNWRTALRKPEHSLWGLIYCGEPFCSSKTRAKSEYLKKNFELVINHVENGWEDTAICFSMFQF